MFLVSIHQNFCSSTITKATFGTKALINFTFSASIFIHHQFPALSSSFISYSGCDKIDWKYYTVANSIDYLF